MKHADIDALARLLDGDLPREEATAETRALGAFAQALEASAAPVPAMERRADIRAMLVEAAREQAASPSLLTRVRTSVSDATARWRYSTRTAAATGAAALALSSGGVSLAAHRALPSDPFYPVKLTLEDIRLAFIGDHVERGRQMLAYAEDRLGEAQFSVADGDMAGAQRALVEADATARTAAGYIIRASRERDEPELLALLTEFAAVQRQRLDALLPHLSGDARVAAEDALVSLRRIDQRVAVLSGPCTECDDVTRSGDGSAQAADDAGSGTSGASRSGGGAPAGDDFDLSVIPPASEPFSPCDCVTAEPVQKKANTTGKKATEKTEKTKGADKPAAPPADDPAEEPDPRQPSDPKDTGDDDNPSIPNEIEDPVDDAVKEVEDVIDDVLTNPSPPSPDDLPLPALPKSLPTEGLNLP